MQRSENFEFGFLGSHSAGKILNLPFLARTQRGENFEFAFLGARSAEKILNLVVLVPRHGQKNRVYLSWRTQRGENFDFACLGARSTEKILQRWTGSPVFFRIWCAQCGENFDNVWGLERFIDIKHNGIAKTSLRKVFFGIFVRKTQSPTLHFFFT